MKRRGKGIAAGLCPVGMSGGGDAAHADICLEPDGSFEVRVGSVDLGQGSKTVLRQLAADALGVSLEAVSVAEVDTETSPSTSGTFASRVTFMDGNAVLDAAADLKRQLGEWAAHRFSVDPSRVSIKNGCLVLADDMDRVLATLAGVAAMTGGGGGVVGHGAYVPAGGHGFDPATGKMKSIAAMSFVASVAEVEVDTETGMVDVLKVTQAFEAGTVINPLLAKSQVHGGLGFGLGFALREDAHPYYPSLEFAVDGFRDYFLATASDYPLQVVTDFVEVPHPEGPRGAKGFGEGLPVTGVASAIIAAIHDAVGVWVTDLPATPERILSLLAKADSAKRRSTKQTQQRAAER